MLLNTKYRTDKPETMDDFAMEGEVLREALDKIAIINQLLGGNRLTLLGLKSLIAKVPKAVEITIVDVGCGNGDMLRNLADYAIENHLNFKLIGIDANSFTCNHALKLSDNYPNISYRCEDIFDKAFMELKYDIVLCT
jgi:2-polyprenyl-3-methyl-5-hydroxy-6-metoxy-1,4-benzoquinol methylase